MRSTDCFWIDCNKSNLQNFDRMQAPQSLPVELDSVVLERASALWEHANLSLGIPGIDAQHAWLVALVLELEWVLHHEKDSVPERFLVIIEEARKYASFHFEAEEQLFKSFQFGEQDPHVKSHRKFELTLAQITDNTGMIDRQQAEKLYRFLRKWLISHILVEDRKYADFLRRRKLLQEAQRFLEAANPEVHRKGNELYQLLSIISRTNTNMDVTTPEVLKEIKSIWNRFNLKVGIPIIDIQHIWLIKMIVDMDEAMTDSALTREAVLAHTIGEAIEYIDVHFRTEEELLEVVGYSDISDHKNKHKAFEKFVKTRQQEFVNGNHRSAGMIVTDLREWLANHIAFEDKQIADFYVKNKEAALNFSKEAISSGRAGIRQNQVNLYKEIVQK